LAVSIDPLETSKTPNSRPNGTGIVAGVVVSPFGAAVFNLNSAVKEDENGADAQKHEGF
jgi:hypothetical protein